MQNGSAGAGFYLFLRSAFLPMEESAYYTVIAATFFGFIALAFVLLFPIYRFIRREEKHSESWTEPALAERQRLDLHSAGDGAVASEHDANGPGGSGQPPELQA